ncbi:hypothetical protein EDD37DRAFT_647037 [Exophiala viscosa]|uniref:Uncharacterized protein n=1 Tax=Exophiala viscosa TaxID=2486360 RepID=A0AAN6E6Q3_9EURO|nr:hypothetical protein EDD36DRAFT_459881 [Exophiala viscosa]KAI1627355.1 hypothetical protein EDD37DRAFT_647037 [Exophiala viscosa]
MSDRRRRHSYDNYIYDESRDPIVIEREPQVRSRDRIIHRPPQKLTLGSKLYNLFKIRRKKVSIIEETPVRSRHKERHIRVLSPSPSPSPPPPREPYHVMADRLFVPLPPEMPPKRRDDEVTIKYVKVKKPKDRHPLDPHDVHQHPVVVTNGHHRHDREHERDRAFRPDHDIRDDLIRRERRERREAEERLERERQRRHDAERVAARAQAEAELLQERRYGAIEREPRDRERRRDRDRDMAQVILREPREVVVVPNSPPTALDRARHDFRRTRERDEYEEQLRGRPQRAIMFKDDVRVWRVGSRSRSRERPRGR